MTGGAETGFRRDIEGLRAICVLAVALYHARIPGVSGGFAGVDVFFVISGYLITCLLLREQESRQKISLVDFWGRRARRLMPNACLTLLAIVGAAYLLMPGYALEAVSVEAASAAVYVSNIVFAAKSVDYFHAGDAASPVLHFWSLSVEEQFYLVWPVLLALIGPLLRRSVRTRVGILLASITAGSLALSLWHMQSSQPAAFFEAPDRAWQLGLGGVLACLSGATDRLPSSVRFVLSWAGLAAVVASFAVLSDATHYPGYWALLPALGCAGVIAGGGEVSLGAGKLLGIAPLTWLGRRSYSLYLWHWPILAFLPIALPDLPLINLAALAVALVVASIAYELIENPIRSNRWLGRAPVVTLASAAVLMAAVVSASAALNVATKGTPVAGMAEAIKAASVDLPRTYPDKCHLAYDDVEQPPCVYGAPQAARTAVLFGDSHAAQWFPALDAAASAAGWRFEAWTKTSCPSIDVAVWYEPRKAVYEACSQWRARIMARLLGPDKPDLVILANLIRYDGALFNPVTGKPFPAEETRAAWEAGMQAMLKKFQAAGIRVAVIRDTPRMNDDYRDCLSKATDLAACAKPRAWAAPADGPDVKVAREHADVRVIDVTDKICGPVRCEPWRGGAVIYQDSHHLTARFVLTLAPAVEPLFAGN